MTFMIAPLVLADNVGSRRVPVVTLALIAACVLVHAGNALALGGSEQITAFYGVNDSAIMTAFELGNSAIIMSRLSRIFVYMFVHTGWLHLLGNMIGILAFGPALEERLGRLKFFALFCASGIVAAVCYVVWYVLTSKYLPGTITIGASPAVFGMMGAYLLLWPNATLYGFLLPLPFILKVKAFWVIWFTALLQVFEGLALPDQSWFGDGHNRLAHLFGLTAGILLALLARQLNWLVPLSEAGARKTIVQRFVAPLRAHKITKN
jgi:membrane associated rhomboid family serine protease